jgi:hypothetical protein
MDTFGDHVFRWCANCGETFLLTSCVDALAWERVLEPEETRPAGVPVSVAPVEEEKPKRKRKSRSKKVVEDLPDAQIVEIADDELDVDQDLYLMRTDQRR